MKIFNVVMPNGQATKMTLAKVLKYKAKGKLVKIVDVAEIIDKSYKGKNNGER